jgi:hypothetical protein
MNEQDYMVQGMHDAAEKHDPAAMLERYHKGRDQVVPYVPPVRVPDNVPDTGALTPSQIRSIKAFGIVGSLVTFWVSFFQVCATGAMNTVFQYGGGAVFLAIVISELRGTVSSGSGANRKSGGGSQYHYHNHYHQNNNFGNGGANQHAQ